MHVGQGHGVEGSFAGLPKEYANPDDSKIVLIPVPFDKTSTYLKGSEKGPDAIIEASRNLELYDIETASQVYLRGIYTDRPVFAETSKTMLDLCYERVLDWLKKDKFVVTIGGEHSISYAPIKAHLDYYGAITLLQLDAHADLQPAYENNPWSHASVMARVKELPNIKIVSVGIRSMSAEELPYLDKSNTFFAHEILDIESVLEKLAGPLYITLDIDVLDSSLMPSTGTPEPGGLDWNQVMHLLKLAIHKTDLVGFDLVELCPQPNHIAPDYLAAKLIYKMLSYKFGKV